MSSWIRRSLVAGVFSVSMVAAQGGVAHADIGMVSAGNSGVLNGNQVFLPVQVPINVCGNAVALLIGFAAAQCEGGAEANIDSFNGTEDDEEDETSMPMLPAFPEIPDFELPEGPVGGN